MARISQHFRNLVMKGFKITDTLQEIAKLVQELARFKDITQELEKK